jgi:phage-related protein
MAEPLWKFDGYVTAAGKATVRHEYLTVFDEDERDAIRDRVRYLKHLPKNLWTEPPFKHFGGDFGEIRDTSPRGALRVYGQFIANDKFLLLHACIKKKNKDKDGVDKAKLRLKEFNKKNGGASEFNFEEEPSKQDSSEQGDEIEAGSEESSAGDRVPN